MSHVPERSAPPAPDAELRLATLVKCDIVDSTRTWSALDPSDALALSRGFRRVVEEVVQRRGGFVERWEGDGALIVFGYPHAREDAPETGVHAGLELAQGVRQLRAGGKSLEFRVGVASGPIAVDLVSKALEGMVFNAAERIKTMAEPGQVLIDDNTRRLAKSFFEYQDLGRRPAKGYEDGLQAWRVLGETPIVSRFAAQRYDPSRGEIVGRSAELAQLAQAWSLARAGKGQVVLIVGDAGMGKSRLVRAAWEWALRDDAVRVELDCTPSTGNTPLYPVGAWLRQAAGLAGAVAADADKAQATRAFLASLLPAGEVDGALAALSPLFGLPAAAGMREGAPEALRERTIAAVLQVLKAYAGERPLAVFCEDLHWIDDTTATVLQQFAQQLAAQRALLVATARSPSDVPLDRTRIAAGLHEIALAPLAAAEATDLIRAVAQGAALSSAMIDGIVRRCEGVPLVLEEVTRAALESASGVALDGPAAAGGPVPAPLQLVVESRLERWQDYKTLVQAASVLGREFSVGLLAGIVPAGAMDVPQAVRLLAEHGWFSSPADTPAGRARFTHAMIRDAVYQTLLRDDRRQLHACAADTLRAGGPGVPEAGFDELAQHLSEAARHEESIEVRLAASADTLARGAYVEAEGHCRAGLQLLPHVAQEARRRELQFRLLLQLGVALTGRHGYSAPQVEATYRQAREACGETAQAEMLYPIVRGLAAFNLVGGKLAAGHELSLQAMELAEQSGRAAFRIDAMSVHCYAALYFRSLAECRTWIRRCLSLYRAEHGETLEYPVPNDAATAALAILPTVEWLLGDAAAAEAAIDEGLRHVDRPNRDFDKAYMQAWIAGVRFTQRRFAESRAAALQALEIGQRNGFREWYVNGFLVSRLAQAAMAPSPEALKEATDMCMALAAEGVGLNASWYLWALARGYRVAGQDAVAAQLIAQAFQRARASEETRMESELLIAQAELTNDDDAALAMLLQAWDTAQRQGAPANALRAAAAWTLRSGGDAQASRIAGDALACLDGRAPVPREAGWMMQQLQALRQGRLNAAG